MKKRILFLCTANAARSQMAEGLARGLHGEKVDVVSAGSRPAGWVHPDAIRALADIGIDIADSTSKSANEFINEPFDVVVTVCDSAAKDCPRWPGAKRIEHWSIDDPTALADPAARYKRFVATRDDLAARIAQLIEQM